MMLHARIAVVALDGSRNQPQTCSSRLVEFPSRRSSFRVVLEPYD